MLQWTCKSKYFEIQILHASKVMLKILQARLPQYVTWELPDVQAGFRKGRGPEIKLPTSTGSCRKQESPRKTSISALLTMPKPWLCGSQQTVENSSRDGNTRPPDLPPEKSYMQVKKQQLDLHMELTASKSGKEYIKAVYCHPAYLIYMQSTSWKSWAGWNTN